MVKLGSANLTDPGETKKRSRSEQTLVDNATPNSRKKKKGDSAVHELRGLIQSCCKRNDLLTAIEAYDAAISQGTRIEAQTFYNLLNLCDGLGGRGIHIGTPKPNSCNEMEPAERVSQESVRDVDSFTRRRHAERIKAHMDKLSLPLTETAYTALLKIFSKHQAFNEVEKLLVEAESRDQCRPKLRMYACVLKAYCEFGRTPEAVRIWHRLSKQQLVCSEREYLDMIKSITISGHAAIMERVLFDLSEDVLVPSRETARAIVEWFQSPYATKGQETSTSSECLALLSEIKVPYAYESKVVMGPVQAEKGWVVSESCPLDATSGRLLEGWLKDEVLQPVSISVLGWEAMKKMNEDIVREGSVEGNTSAYLGGGKGAKGKPRVINADQRLEHWKRFQDYLSRRLLKRKIEIIIDGANVGYFANNFGGAPKHVDYLQIDWIVEHFLKEGKAVLLVLHSRHFARNLMPRKFHYLQNSWEKKGVLYCTPPGMNDDWFWMHAALQAGPGTLVVTNDEMRDHHFQMLSPRSFLRWKDRHQIHFSFGSWKRVDGSGTGSRHVELIYPDVYSRRIQRTPGLGLLIPNPKRGDEGRFLDGSHVAEEDTLAEETYLCIKAVDLGDA
jgi:pentatricopeptide repeat protein